MMERRADVMKSVGAKAQKASTGWKVIVGIGMPALFVPLLSAQLYLLPGDPPRLNASSGPASLGASARDAQANVVSDPSISWSSSQTSVVTINSNGLATAMGPGTANIQLSTGALTGVGSVTVTTSDGGDGGTNGVLFASDWSTALGNGSDALLDGGRWDHVDCAQPLLDVQASGLSQFGQHPGSLNALVVDGSSAGACQGVHAVDAWNPGYQAGDPFLDYALRFYINYRLAPGAGDHSAQAHNTGYTCTWFMSADNLGSSYTLRWNSALGANSASGIWEAAQVFPLSDVPSHTPFEFGFSKWYRQEVLFKRNPADPNQYRMFVRTYSVTDLATGAGSLLFDWDDYGTARLSDAAYRTWADYYDIGGAERWWQHAEGQCPSGDGDTYWNDLWFGNNGSTRANDGSEMRAITGVKVVAGSNLDRNSSVWVGDLTGN